MGMTTSALNGGDNIVTPLESDEYDPITGQGTEVNPSDYCPEDYYVSPLEQDIQMVIQLLQEISAKLDRD
jgi:hypothetical protein|tara:strand:+ start:6721 stop:6930 length:210 start_codon:yes stop_codon:yes gene_type:complete